MAISMDMLVLNLLFAFLIVCGFFCMRYKLIRMQALQMQELSAPLLANATGTAHRLDTATREAAKGYNVCKVCAFENFKASAYCTICGGKIAGESATNPDDSASDGVKTGEAGVRLHQIQVKPSAEQLTQRQLRARKRREWTRKLDIEGKMFWYREPVSSLDNPANSFETGFVVRFHVNSAEDENEEKAPVVESTMETNEGAYTAEHNDASDNNTSSKNRTVSATKSEPLSIFSQEISMDVLVAGEADASEFATGESLDALERRKEVVAQASQDFPTKFANFVVTTASLLVPAEVEFLKVSVHRAFVLEESMEHLCCIDDKFIRSVMRINFIEESGIDAGGLHREWFMLLNDLLMEPSTGLFVCTNPSEQVYTLNPNSKRDNGDDHLMYYFATGRLVGRALLEGVVMNFHLTIPLLKIILGIPVTMSDLEYLDPETYRSMQWIADHDGVEALCLDFSVVHVTSSSGDVEIVDLIPNGRNIAVTDANKRQYLERKFHYIMFESIAPQLHMFLKGMYDVIPLSLLMLFDAEELDYLLCGSQEIDVKDWRCNSVHSSYLAQTPVLNAFWEIVGEMPNEYRRRLLQFTTGCSRVPLVGFKGLTSYDGKVCLFTLKMLPVSGPQYIRSHACFNRVDLPIGVSKRELQDMLFAILDTERYGFTTN